VITRPEESYRLCCVVVCDLETSRIGAPYIYDISSLRVKHLVCFKIRNSCRWNYEKRLMLQRSAGNMTMTPPTDIAGIEVLSCLAYAYMP